MKVIESEQNPRFKNWLSLHESRGVKKHGLCLISGEKYIPEIWPLIKDQAEVLCYDEAQFNSFMPSEDKCYRLSKKLYNQLNPFNSNSLLVVCKLPEVKTWEASSPVQGLELFLALSDPSNLGACLRSAEAFGVAKVILLSESAHPFHTKSIKASSGSVFRLKLYNGPSIKDLQGGEAVVCLDAQGEDLNKYTWPKNVRLLVGEEGRGIPESLKQSSQKLKINMMGANESLSAPIAASLALYSYNSTTGAQR